MVTAYVCGAGQSGRVEENPMKNARNELKLSIFARCARTLTKIMGLAEKNGLSVGMTPKIFPAGPDRKLSARDALPCRSDDDAATFLFVAVWSRRFLMPKVRCIVTQVSR